jgi:hypothetical protein
MALVPAARAAVAELQPNSAAPAAAAPANPEQAGRQAADPRETARALGNRAADAIARGEHVEAEELLRRAYAAYPAPTIAVLHARTLVHLQRLAAAASVYERATLTSLGPDAPPVFFRAVEQARAEARELRPRVPRLQIVVRGRAAHRPELKLWLDERALPVAQRGRWMLVDPGRRVVQAELGDASSEQIVRVEERQSVVVEVSEPASASTSYRVMSWAAVGVGVGGVTTGVVTGLAATTAHARAVERCPDERCVEGGAGARDLERFKLNRAISTVSYAVGAIGFGLGGYLLIGGALDGPALQVELDQRGAMLQWGGTL